MTRSYCLACLSVSLADVPVCSAVRGLSSATIKSIHKRGQIGVLDFGVSSDVVINRHSGGRGVDSTGDG